VEKAYIVLQGVVSLKLGQLQWVLVGVSGISGESQ